MLSRVLPMSAVVWLLAPIASADDNQQPVAAATDFLKVEIQGTLTVQVSRPTIFMASLPDAPTFRVHAPIGSSAVGIMLPERPR